jgi:hypothetical protein
MNTTLEQPKTNDNDTDSDGLHHFRCCPNGSKTLCGIVINFDTWEEKEGWDSDCVVCCDLDKVLPLCHPQAHH